jgi:hypothetical protein
MIGIPTNNLAHLFSTLKGDPVLNSPLQLTKQAKLELLMINEALFL